MANVDLKIVLLGAQNVGKSCLVDRYVNSAFDEKQKNTIGAAFAAKRVQTSRGQVTVGLWDTAGAERFESLSRVYYHGAKGAIVCYDATSPFTWKKLRFWMGELQESEPTCSVFIVVTKCDLWLDGAGSSPAHSGSEASGPTVGAPGTGGLLPREVPEEEVREYAESVGARVFYTSSRTGFGVREMFEAIAEDLATHKLPQRASEDVARVRLTDARPAGDGEQAGASRAAHRAGCCS
ncbi:unnamed protein product [Pedinophyceae sp. YPF-701]|nr:unnamed protein product [Pedinophyceae sp. YPF-701]